MTSGKEAGSGRPPGTGGGDGTASASARPPRLKGKVALVTGGGGGIGREISLLFASEGASVVAAGRRSEPLQETVREIRRRGGVGTFTRGDVSRSEKVEAIVQAAIYNFGGLDILVNGAGINMQGSILKTEERRWDKIMSVNLKGPYLVSRCAVPAMRERGGGSIVNIAGTAGLVGRKEAAAFSASKGGLLALTRSMALDLAPDAIRVNAICPGSARSLAAPGGQEGARAGWRDSVAHLALYLASDESSWVTGSFFTVDGGLLGGRDGG